MPISYEQREFLISNKIKKYEVKDDGSIDILQDVYIVYNRGFELPVRINRIEGSFISFPTRGFDLMADSGTNVIDESLRITSLVGCPQEVSGSFTINGWDLESLEGGPVSVGKSYTIKDCNLKSLKGSPNKILNGNFSVIRNKLESLRYGPTDISGDYCFDSNNVKSFKHCTDSIGGSFVASNNPIEQIDHFPYYVGGNSIELDRTLITDIAPILLFLKNFSGKIILPLNIQSGLMKLIDTTITGIEFERWQSTYNVEDSRLCRKNNEALDILLKYLGQGRPGMLKAQAELIENDHEEYLN